MSRALFSISYTRFPVPVKLCDDLGGPSAGTVGNRFGDPGFDSR